MSAERRNTRTRKSLRYVGYATCWGLLVAALVFQDSQKLLLNLLLLAFLACCAYGLSIDSPKSRRELMKNAVVIAVALGALSFVTLGHSSSDEDGMVIDEGFEATYEMRAVAAVETFTRVLGAAVVGVWLACLIRDRERRSRDELGGGQAEEPDTLVGGITR